MMKGILHLHIGQCGNDIGLKYWESILEEHGIDPTGSSAGASDLQLRGANVSFEEVSEKRYAPRAIFIDLDPASTDSVRGSSLGKLFRPENIIHGKHGTGNNYAKGFNTGSSDLSEQIKDNVSKLIERCDGIQGIHMTHSIGGGTGSGLGSTLLQDLMEHFPGILVNDFTIFPAKETSDIVVEPYNAVLALHTIQNYTTITQVIDNKALYNIAASNLKFRSPTYKDLNQIVGSAMAGVTSCLRFPGQLNSSVNKLALNLIPFPRMHFLSIGYAPLFSGLKQGQPTTVHNLVSELFDPRNFLCSLGSEQGKYLTAAAMFRGKISTSEVEEEMADLIKQKGKQVFVEWVPDNIKTSYCDVPGPSADGITATLVAHHTAVKEVFRDLDTRFQSMFKRKVFLHWYTGEGMDDMEFMEAEANMCDIIAEYQTYQDATVEYYDDDEEAVDDVEGVEDSYLGY